MELYNLYFAVITALGFAEGIQLDGLKVLYLGVIGAIVIWAGLFVLQGVGLYAMAKKQNVDKAWRAFVPFVNLLLIGQLAGECTVFGKKMKRVGLYAMIAQIVGTAVCVFEIFSDLYLYTVEGVPTYDQYNNPYWLGATGFSLFLTNYLTISGVVLPFVQMAYEIMIFIIVMSLYKKYVPNSYLGLGVLSLFFPLARYIVVFAIRNRPLIDFEAYMRAKREAYRYRGYFSYDSPYNNSNENPYGQPREPKAEKPKAEPKKKSSSKK